MIFDKRDTITTIAIGRLDKRGAALDPMMWFEVGAHVTQACMRHGDLVSVSEGNGVTTDQPHFGIEECKVFIVSNANEKELRNAVEDVLDNWDLSSACFAHDPAHEPAKGE